MKTDKTAMATTHPAMYPIYGARFKPPSLTGATKKKQTHMNVRNVAGSDISQWFFLTDAKYAAQVHKVMVART